MREIGFRLEPPIPINSVGEAQSAVSGEVKLKVKQDGKEIEEFVDLSLTGWSLSESGVWSKLVFRYAPIGTFFCNTQMITIDAQNVNFDLQQHGVTVYVSRDRRP